MLNFILSLFLISPLTSTPYEDVVNYIKTLSDQNPQTTELINIGISDSNQPIYALKIGHGEVPTLVVATHHGNEYGSTTVALGLAESLAQEPIEGRTVYLIPVLNISGYNKGQREETLGYRTYDSNRDYPGPCRSGTTFRLKSTKALADFIAEKNIVVSATLHTYLPGVLYPWGISTRDTSTPYDDEFIALGNMATQESGYLVGNSTEALYAADGTYEDYAFWKHGAWSLLFELGRTHSPGQNDLQHMVDVNVPGIRRFLAQAPAERAVEHEFTGQCDYSSRVPRRIHPE